MALCLVGEAWAGNPGGKLRSLVSSFKRTEGFDVVDQGGPAMLLLKAAVRAGYNFTTIPEYEYNGTIKTTLKDRMDSFSVGIGYYSKGSFFADLAARLTMMSDEYISPYIDYLSDVASPLILNKRERYDITATFGWRF